MQRSEPMTLECLQKQISVVTDVIETVLAGKHVDVSPF